MIENDACNGEVEQHIPTLAEADVQGPRVVFLQIGDRIAAGRIDNDFYGRRVALKLLVSLGKGYEGIGAV